MIQLKKYFILLVFALVFFQACKKETIREEISLDEKAAYYPMFVGKWIEYDGDTINYVNTATGIQRDTTRFVMREEFESLFYGPDSSMNYRIFVKVKYEGDSLWQTLHTWYVQRNGNFIDKTEGNLRFQKLLFPIYTNKTWNGTVYITQPSDFNDPDWSLFNFYKNWEFNYEYVDAFETINSMPLDSVCKVLQKDSKSKVHKTLVYEKYAKNIGMVEKEFWQINKSTICNGCEYLDYDEAETGYIVHLKIKDHN